MTLAFFAACLALLRSRGLDWITQTSASELNVSTTAHKPQQYELKIKFFFKSIFKSSLKKSSFNSKISDNPFLSSSSSLIALFQIWNNIQYTQTPTDNLLNSLLNFSLGMCMDRLSTLKCLIFRFCGIKSRLGKMLQLNVKR